MANTPKSPQIPPILSKARVVRFLEPEHRPSLVRIRSRSRPQAPSGPAPPTNTPVVEPQPTKEEVTIGNPPIDIPMAPPCQIYVREVSWDHVSSVRELLSNAKSQEPSGILNFVEEALNTVEEKFLILKSNGDPQTVKFSWKTAEDPSPSESGLKHMQNTPMDIYHTILDQLDEASSTSLGLTCKAFWAIHKLRYPFKNNLLLQSTPSRFSESFLLFQILSSWMGEDRHYIAIDSPLEGKFMTKKQCVDKIVKKNMGVEAAKKVGCWGLWVNGEGFQSAPYQKVVFSLAHEKVKLRIKENSVKWKLVMETPKGIWVDTETPSKRWERQHWN